MAWVAGCQLPGLHETSTESCRSGSSVTAVPHSSDFGLTAYALASLARSR